MCAQEPVGEVQVFVCTAICLGFSTVEQANYSNFTATSWEMVRFAHGIPPIFLEWIVKVEIQNVCLVFNATDYGSNLQMYQQTHLSWAVARQPRQMPLRQPHALFSVVSTSTPNSSMWASPNKSWQPWNLKFLTAWLRFDSIVGWLPLFTLGCCSGSSILQAVKEGKLGAVRHFLCTRGCRQIDQFGRSLGNDPSSERQSIYILCCAWLRCNTTALGSEQWPFQCDRTPGRCGHGCWCYWWEWLQPWCSLFSTGITGIRFAVRLVETSWDLLSHKALLRCTRPWPKVTAMLQSCCWCRVLRWTELIGRVGALEAGQS